MVRLLICLIRRIERLLTRQKCDCDDYQRSACKCSGDNYQRVENSVKRSLVHVADYTTVEIDEQVRVVGLGVKCLHDYSSAQTHCAGHVKPFSASSIRL